MEKKTHLNSEGTGEVPPRLRRLRIMALLAGAILIGTFVISGVIAQGKYRDVMGDSNATARNSEFNVRHRIAVYYEEKKENRGWGIFEQQNTNSRILLPAKEYVLETLEEKLYAEAKLFRIDRGFKLLPLPHFYCRIESQNISENELDWKISRIEIGNRESLSWEEVRVDWREKDDRKAVRNWKMHIEQVYPVEFDLIVDLASLPGDQEWHAGHIYVKHKSHSIEAPNKDALAQQSRGGSFYGGLGQSPANVVFNLASRHYEARSPRYVHFREVKSRGQKHRSREYGYRLHLDAATGSMAGKHAEIPDNKSQPEPAGIVEPQPAAESTVSTKTGPLVVRADLPSDAMLLADCENIKMFNGDLMEFTAFVPGEDTWIHVWKCKDGGENLERGVEAIVHGTGTLFGSNVSRHTFTRPDGAPAGYTYRTIFGEGQWIGAVGLNGTLYRIMLTGDGSEAAMRQVGERIINTLRLEARNVEDSRSRVPAPLRSRTFTSDVGGWQIDIPTDMHSIPPPFPGMAAAFQGTVDNVLYHLFVINQTEALQSMGTSPAALLRDVESGVYAMQMSAWEDIRLTRQAAQGIRIKTLPGIIAQKESALQYAFSVEMPAYSVQQRYYFIICEKNFLVFSFATELNQMNIALADQIIATYNQP